jgi:hypothetical protein
VPPSAGSSAGTAGASVCSTPAFRSSTSASRVRTVLAPLSVLACWGAGAGTADPRLGTRADGGRREAESCEAPESVRWTLGGGCGCETCESLESVRWCWCAAADNEGARCEPPENWRCTLGARAPAASWVWLADRMEWCEGVRT